LEVWDVSVPADVKANTSVGADQSANVLLAIRNLSVSFRTASSWLPVVTDVSFAIRAGETVGIVGESGCGKSLTALSILGLLPRHGCRATGEIIFEGRQLVGLRESALRQIRGRRISMIFQEPMTALDPVFTVGEQISETVRTHFPISRSEARDRALAALESVGIPSPRHCFDQYPLWLSGGMRQRVMIAVALVCEPRLLIADEPTTALDATVQAQIIELLLDLSNRTGAALLFITHNLGLVAESCSRMLTMYAGEIVEDASVDEAIARPLHPYTSGLLLSLPGLSRRKSTLPSIPGRVPAPSEMPSGCRFAPRCQWVEPQCGKPQGMAVADERRVRCRRHESLTLPGAMR
jgi:peptide/nickel transport system ATP-binding protein